MIQEAQAQKRELEAGITALVMAFHKETRCKVVAVGVALVSTMELPAEGQYPIETEVSL